MSSAGTITVDFVGSFRTLEPNQHLSFGREADLVIDNHAALPRVVGVLAHQQGHWWIHNETAAADLTVRDVESSSHAVIAPGSGLPVVFGSSIVEMSAGPARYALELELGGRQEPQTRPWSHRQTVRLNAEQRQLLAALAESRLRGGAPFDIPSNADVASGLGWTITKFNRKLDHLCIKFDKIGVDGLRGSQDRLATDRRRRLVEHCVAAGIVTEADLFSWKTAA